MKVKLFFLIFLSVICSGADGHNMDGSDNRVYSYVGISDPSAFAGSIKFDTKDRTVVYPATYVSYRNCSTAIFFCIESPKLSFCVPKATRQLKQWVCGEQKESYENSGAIELLVLGRNIPVTIISASGVEYYYNPDFGIVMLRIHGRGGAEEVYWSASRLGLGSRP